MEGRFCVRNPGSKSARITPPLRPQSDPEISPGQTLFLLFVLKLGRTFSQATAVWQWYNYLESQTPTGFKLLRLNLDETSVKLYQGDQKGTCFFKKKRPREPNASEEGAGEEGRGMEQTSQCKRLTFRRRERALRTLG